MVTLPPCAWNIVKEFAILVCPRCAGQCELEDYGDLSCWMDDLSQREPWCSAMSTRVFYQKWWQHEAAKKRNDKEELEELRQLWLDMSGPGLPDGPGTPDDVSEGDVPSLYSSSD